MHINFSKTRQFFLFSVALIFFITIISRLYYIQIVSNKPLSELAARQHKFFIRLEPHRGYIYDRLRRMLGVYLDTTSVYAVPREIESKGKTAKTLSREFALDEGAILKRLKKDNYFAWVKRKLDEKEAEKAKALDIEGVYLTSEYKRFYPGGRLACHVLGMTGTDNDGLEGIELYYNSDLKGEYGWRRSYRDAKKREIVSFETQGLPAENGTSLVLTIDEVIQHTIEKEIENIVKTCKPQGVSIVAMDPRSGEILGMANYPAFDPNHFTESDANSLRNRAITDVFEPGSVFKIVAASAALEEKTVDFETEFFCENGQYKVGNRILHDYKPYGKLKFRQIIEKSSNIGVAKVAATLGKQKLYEYIRRFNFHNPTGIDLPGEAGGIVRNLSDWSYSDMTTIPMGQGIAVTALQLTCMVSTIANEGVMMRPFVVLEFLNENGEVIKRNEPKHIDRVISVDTAIKVKELLRNVVKIGTGKRARLENFEACGKTGTAQKVNPRGGYYKDKYIASFIGFAPFDNPEVALAICIDEPRGKHFGGQIAAPAFKNIMNRILPYMSREKVSDET